MLKARSYNSGTVLTIRLIGQMCRVTANMQNYNHRILLSLSLIGNSPSLRQRPIDSSYPSQGPNYAEGQVHNRPC